MTQAKDIDILPALRILIPEFVKYAINRIPYYYPLLLPEDMISEEVKTGEIQRNLWVPLEDLYTGWEKSGQVGQEVYGVGSAFAVVPRQYLKLNEDLMVFVDYPVISSSKRQNTMTIKLDGNPEMQCNLKIISVENKKITAKVFQENEILKAFKKTSEMHEYKISGKGSFKIKY